MMCLADIFVLPSVAMTLAVPKIFRVKYQRCLHGIVCKRIHFDIEYVRAREDIVG